MKELLTSMITQLQDDADLSYIDDANIVITPDIDVIPITLNFPAITLKDDSVRREGRCNLRWKVWLNVQIVVFQLLKVGDISVMGQTFPEEYGVLEIVSDIHTSLNNNVLGITGMQSAQPAGVESGSETVGYEDLVLQRKIIIYEYLKNETHS